MSEGFHASGSVRQGRGVERDDTEGAMSESAGFLAGGPQCGRGENPRELNFSELQGTESERVVPLGRRSRGRLKSSTTSATVIFRLLVVFGARGEKVRSSNGDDDFASSFSVHRRVVSCSDQLTPLPHAPLPVSLPDLLSLLPVVFLQVLIINREAPCCRGGCFITAGVRKFA